MACEKAAWRPDPRTGRAFPPHSKTGGSSWSAPGSFKRHGALRREDPALAFDLLTSIATGGGTALGDPRGTGPRFN
jgi:hypothetical protein